VNATDLLDYGLLYLNSTIDRYYDPTNTTKIDNHTVVWDLSDLVPNKRRIIRINATLTGSKFLNNTVNTTWGCGAVVCQEVNAPTVRVELPPTRLMIVKHLAGVIDECGDNASFLIEVKNVGETYAYDVNITELLPSGLQYVAGSSNVTGAVPSSTDFTGNPLIWKFNQSEGWAPGTDVTITFNVTVTGPCDFTGGDAVAGVNYTVPCGDFGIEAENTVKANGANPQLSITKTPSLTIVENGSTVNWTITIKSDGDYEAKNITLKDVLPTNTDYVWSDPAKDGGGGTAGDPLVWNMANMTAGSVTTIHLSANVTGCTADLTENNAAVLWGCCIPKKKSTAIAKLRTSPVIELSEDHDYIDTCGGNYTIKIENTGSNASVVCITDVLPEGFVYRSNSSSITSSNSSRTFANEEPLDHSMINRTLVWNSTNIGTVHTGETVRIEFGIENCVDCCGNAIPSYNNVSCNYTGSCGNDYKTNFAQPITPNLANLSIRKEPPTQVVGTAKWTIYVSNNGTGTACNVTVYDILGDGYRNDTIEVTHVNGTADTKAAIKDNTIRWAAQTIPIGIDVWIRKLSAETNITGLLDNNVSVYGTCPTGCVYSRDGDTVYATRLNLTKVPNGTLTIGEYANFTITAQFWGPGESYDDVNITDTLPIGFRYMDSNATDDGGKSYDADITSWHAGDYSYYRWYIGNFT
jgi:uncharacterized repeat protein (TIGR01451 family)